MNFQITPKTLILSCMQVADQRTIPIKLLVAVGEIFGFTGNTIRVTTTRLIRAGRIKSDERGLYRLSDEITPFSRYLDSWRLGEALIKPWDGRWIAYVPSGLPKKRQQDNTEKLTMTGFKCGHPGMLIRPNNLNMEFNRLKAVLSHLDDNPNPFVFIASDFEKVVIDNWVRGLWPVDELIREQAACVEKLKKSAARLETISPDKALVESYLLGSEAVHLLVNDPLLPEEMMSGQYRIALTRQMLEYDTLGKRIWKNRFIDLHIQTSPAHIQV